MPRNQLNVLSQKSAPLTAATHISIPPPPWTGATVHQPGTANCLFSAIRIWTMPPRHSQPDLPSLCALTASSAWCPCWQGNTRLFRRGWWCRAVTSALQQQLVVTDLHCIRIRHHVIKKKMPITKMPDQLVICTQV